MTHSISAFPLTVTPDEHAAGFHRMVLSLGDFVGAFPGENVEAAARRLSDFDVLLKMQGTTRSGETRISYRHLRFGYAGWREQLRIVWTDIRFGFWRSWFRGYLPGRTDWQHIPFGLYDHPADDCSRSLGWSRIVGVAFHDYAV